MLTVLGYGASGFPDASDRATVILHDGTRETGGLRRIGQRDADQMGEIYRNTSRSLGDVAAHIVHIEKADDFQTLYSSPPPGRVSNVVRNNGPAS